jgi:hypothetical protein
MEYCGETFVFTSPIYGQKYKNREITERINSHYDLCYARFTYVVGQEQALFLFCESWYIM